MSIGELAVMDQTGDTKIIWDSENEDEVAVAKATFDSLVKKGYAGYSVKRDGEKNEVIRQFDPTAEKLIMAPAMVGG